MAGWWAGEWAGGGGWVGRQAGRQAGWLTDEIWMDFNIFKILYRLNYSDVHFV